MKHFIFRKNYLGFYDWTYAMNKIRRVIHGYGIIGDPEDIDKIWSIIKKKDSH